MTKFQSPTAVSWPKIIQPERISKLIYTNWNPVGSRIIPVQIGIPISTIRYWNSDLYQRKSSRNQNSNISASRKWNIHNNCTLKNQAKKISSTSLVWKYMFLKVNVASNMSIWQATDKAWSSTYHIIYLTLVIIKVNDNKIQFCCYFHSPEL